MATSRNSQREERHSLKIVNPVSNVEENVGGTLLRSMGDLGIRDARRWRVESRRRWELVMRTESSRSFGVAAGSENAGHDLWVGFARLSFLLAVFAGMVAFAAAEHRRNTAALESHVVRPA
jgi:hypothetical protein